MQASAEHQQFLPADYADYADVSAPFKDASCLSKTTPAQL